VRPHPVLDFQADLGDPTEGAKRDASAKEGCVALWNVKEATLLRSPETPAPPTVRWNGEISWFIAYKLSSMA